LKSSWFTPKEFYDQYKEDTEGARKAAFKIGQETGQILKREHNIQGEGLDAIAEILNWAMISVYSEPSAKVEGDKVIKRDRSFCPIMRTAITLEIPWNWLDANLAWPWLEGIVSTVRTDMKMSVPKARSRRDSSCIHIFEIV
jgi:hypothetical protein